MLKFVNGGRIFTVLIIRETEETRCFQTGMAAATPKNVRRLTKIVNTMVPFGETFYGKALTIAFKFLHGAYVRDIYNTQDQTE